MALVIRCAKTQLGIKARIKWDLIDPPPNLGQVIGKPSVRPCKGCGCFEGVLYRPSHTMYHFEGRLGSEEDPNRPIELCNPCDKENHEYWDEMWSEYNSGRL